MSVYFNDNEPYVTQWLGNLFPDARIDSRSISDVRADELVSYERCHFFAGIGGWEYALSLAQWPIGREVWTGSCPCQPFSQAGQRQGETDKRHLWPELRRLINERRPATIFGEQVSSALGRAWLSRVRADLEELGYAVGCADLCAASVGAPHIRQRLYWVADATRRGSAHGAKRNGSPRQHGGDVLRASSGTSSGNDAARSIAMSAVNPNAFSWLAHANGILSRQGGTDGTGRAERSVALQGARPSGGRGDGGLGHALGQRDADARRGAITETPSGMQGEDGQRQWLWPDPWEPSDLIACLDGKSRRLEPGLSPLAHGISARVGKLRAYGNAIVPQVAATFIRAFLETEENR